MVITNDSFLQLNIVPVQNNVPLYDQDQLYYAVEDEFYQLQDIVDQACINLYRNLQNETEGNITLPANNSGYDFFPVNLAGLNTPPTSANFVTTLASYDTFANSVSFGLPDGFGARFGAFQLPWLDTVAQAGTGQPLSILEKYINSSTNYFNFPAVKTPAFDAAWKNFSDQAWMKQHQIDYVLSQTKSIMTKVQTTVGAFQGWNVNNIPGSLLATVQKIVQGNNLNPFKNVSFMNNAFRGLPSILSLSNTQVASKMGTEKLFGADKYITLDARKNIIPMDYGDLQSARAEGALREKILGEKLINGDTTSMKGMTEEEIKARAWSDYSIDQHIENRMKGINAGEEPLPNTRVKVDEIDAEGKVIVKNPAPKGFNGEYVPDDGITRGVGGLPGASDYSPLALGESAESTPIEKEIARAKTGIKTADGGQWGEPGPGYAAKYPDNQVIETRGGIVIEIDSTPGAERLHLYHPSHTYISIDKEGNLKIRNAKDRFELTDKDMKEYIKNNYDRTVDGARTSMVGSNDTEKVGGTKRVTAGMIYLNS